ncbi:Ger(x)C family spore germination protein [Alkaliphilus crotonatoxidans]
MIINKGHTKILIIIILSMLLTGCWDSVEIDERAFVMALGVDRFEPEDDDSPLSKGTGDEGLEALIRGGEKNIETTFVFPKHTSAISGEIEALNVVMSSVGESVYISRQQIASRADALLFLGHLETLLLGEEFVKNKQLFKEFLDAGEKEPMLSRRAALAVVEGKAKDALQVQSKLEPNIGDLLANLLSGTSRTDRAPMMDFGKILTSLRENGNAVIPRITYSEDEIKVAGAAVMKDMSFVGWLGELESLAINILHNHVKSYGLHSYVGEQIVPFDVTNSNTDFKMLMDQNKIKMQVNVVAEADVEQFYFNAQADLLDPRFIEEIQKEAGNTIKIMLDHTISQLQSELQADVIGFDDYIRKHYPKLWREIEKDWDTIFPNLQVEVNVDLKIRRVGLSR